MSGGVELLITAASAAVAVVWDEGTKILNHQDNHQEKLLYDQQQLLIIGVVGMIGCIKVVLRHNDPWVDKDGRILITMMRYVELHNHSNHHRPRGQIQDTVRMRKSNELISYPSLHLLQRGWIVLYYHDDPLCHKLLLDPT